MTSLLSPLRHHERESSVPNASWETRPEYKSIEHIYVESSSSADESTAKPHITIRASSTTDPLLLRFALNSANARLTSTIDVLAFHRLALVRIPGGKSALIHSSSLDPSDGARTTRSLSHILIHPAFRARQALATWGSQTWEAYDQINDGAHLFPLSDLPEAGPLNDQSITAFVQSTDRNNFHSILAQVCPERLWHDHERRRSLLRSFLQGCRLALAASSAAERGRLYFIGEPQLAALLLYAAARLLPDVLTTKMTFSTYEPIHRIEEYTHTRLICTCPTDQAENMGIICYTKLGYALNTFTQECSPELELADQVDIDYWIDRASANDWRSIDRVRDLIGNGCDGLAPEEANHAFRFAKLIIKGRLQGIDLIEARDTSWGPTLLKRCREEIWPQVWEASLTDPLLGESFSEALVEHLPELEQRATEVLKRGSSFDWKPHWELLRIALNEDESKLRETLVRILPNPPFHPDVRLALLEELSTLEMPRPLGPARFQALFMQCTSHDLQLLRDSNLDREWYVWALCHALVEFDAVAEAVRHLYAGNDELLGTFWNQFQLLTNENQRRAVLMPLFGPTNENAQFLIRSLKNHLTLPPETLVWLLEYCRLFALDRVGFWTTDNNIRALLQAMKGLRDEAGPIWERMTKLIEPSLLVSGEASQRVLLLELWAAESQPGSVAPDRVSAILNSWMLLRERFEKASGVSGSSRQELTDACKNLELDPIAILRNYFEKHIMPKGIEKEVIDDFTHFFHSFQPEGKGFPDYLLRAMNWCRVIENCPLDENQARFQKYYLTFHVPDEFRWRIVQDMHRTRLLLLSVHQDTLKLTETEFLSDRHAFLYHSTGLVDSTGYGSHPGNIAYWKRVCWLLPWFVVGACAVLLHAILGIDVGEKGMRWPFLLYALAMSDAVSFQCIALVFLNSLSVPVSHFNSRGALANAATASIGLGALFGVMGGGLAIGLGAPFELCLRFGIVLMASVAMSSVLAASLAVLGHRLRWNVHMPIGILARTLAAISGIVIYVILSGVVSK